mmetsp:Transcript_730/g.2373  ORF Transcript_730/g.2373 Transcript_730/m.2373 type:complete len:211 (+) Transcript_730:1335-1967(+)
MRSAGGGPMGRGSPCRIIPRLQFEIGHAPRDEDWACARAIAAAAASASGAPLEQSTPHVPGTQWQKLSRQKPRPEQSCTQLTLDRRETSCGGSVKSHRTPYQPGKQWHAGPRPLYRGGAHGIRSVRMPRPLQRFARTVALAFALSRAPSSRFLASSTAAETGGSRREGKYAWRSHRPSPNGSSNGCEAGAGGSFPRGASGLPETLTQLST